MNFSFNIYCFKIGFMDVTQLLFTRGLKITIRDKIDKYGFAVVEELYPEKILSEIVQDLGSLWDGIENFAVQLITPVDKAASKPNTYNGTYGYGMFPLHTALSQNRYPPRFIALRCKVGVPKVATLLLDGNVVLDRCGKSMLSGALVHPIDSYFGRVPLLNVFQKRYELELLRWDPLYLKPANKYGEKVCKTVSDVIANENPVSIYLSNVGDTLIVDNWRMLHGRSSIPKGGNVRETERIYLESIN